MNQEYLVVDRRRSRRRLRIMFLGVFLFLGLFFIVVTRFVNDYFDVRTITTEGNERVSEEAVHARVAYFVSKNINSSFFGKLFGAYNMAYMHSIDWKDLQKEDTRFLYTSASLNILNRSLRVEIKEREPFGVWCGGDEKCFWFDKEGRLVSEAPIVQGFLITRIEDSSLRELNLGDLIIEGPVFMEHIMGIIEFIKEMPIPADAIRVENNNDREVKVRFWDTPQHSFDIYFSLETHPRWARDVILSLLKNGELKNAEYVDLRIKNRVYYK